MEKIKFYDTCALLDIDTEKIEDKIYLSSVTLNEIEHIKTSKSKDDDVKFKARKITRWLKDNEEKYECIVANKSIYEIVEDKNLEISNDNLIIATAYDLQDGCHDLTRDVEFYTNDICCYNIAKNVFNLKCNTVNSENIEKYKGYVEMTLDTNEINYLYNEYLENKNNYLGLVENEYLIINDKNTNKSIELKYINNELVQLKLPPSRTIKGLNAKQRCALDLLNNKDIPIKVIAGTYGSGKTLLSVKSALYQVLDKGNNSKIMLVRNPIGSGEQVGYLKGTYEDKTRNFFLPIAQHLDRGEDELEELKMNGVIEASIPYFMKGLSLNDTFVLVDECEDMNSEIFKIVGSRTGENSCVAFVGDWKQSEDKFKYNNGLAKFIDFAKGNKLVGVMVLDDDVRSNASKVFCDFE